MPHLVAQLVTKVNSPRQQQLSKLAFCIVLRALYPAFLQPLFYQTS